MALLADVLDTVMEATVVPSFSKIGYAVRSGLRGWSDLDRYDLSGRTIVVTGANSGLGYAIAEQLAGLGASLRIVVRSDDKGRDTARAIEEATGNAAVRWSIADLTDLDATRAAAAEILAEEDVLDGLVHNAGAMFSERRETDAGIETTVALHVVGPFLLSAQLLPLLRRSTHPARVVWMSSGGMYAEQLDVDTLQSPDDYGPSKAYARAKRAQVVLASEMARRLNDVVVHAMHPGWAGTPGVERSLPGFNKVMGPILRSAEQGGDTAVWLLAAPEGAGRSGSFWLDRAPRSTTKLPGTSTDAAEASRLWHEICRLAGVDEDVFTTPGSRPAPGVAGES